MSSRDSRGLGKGLSALLGEVPNADQLRKPVGYVNKEIRGISTPARRPESADVVRVPVDAVEPNPYQPRMSFDNDALEELATSIRNLGLIQPITVRKMPTGIFQIISGERRFRACRMAGMTTIPAYVRDADDQGMLEMALVENIQREDLDPIELALSYQRLIEECQLTQEHMAERVGKNRTTVANTLRLLKLPAKVQHDIKVGLLSVGHAKAILSIDDPEVQNQLCDLVLRDGLSVRQLEALVRKIQLTPGALPKAPVSAPKEQNLPEDYQRLASNMSRFFANDISVKRSASGKGTLTIRFNSDDEVRAFLEAVEKSSADE